MKHTLLLVVLPLLLLAGGCSHVLSREALLDVDPTIDFAEIKANPQAFQGKTLVLGGLIVNARPGREGTTLEILRYSLDRWGEPQTVDEGGGRFLARSDRFLDPELYQSGLLVTLTGTVEGVESRPLQGYDYVYPVFRIAEAYVWSRRYGPSYLYGYYDPWLYRPYPYYYRDPFWYHDPFWPHPHRPWPPGWWLR
jgi:outer membrane lipoprotein